MLSIDQVDAIVECWIDVVVALVRRYRGNRLKMWERIPNACVAMARQHTRLTSWLTAALTALQIDDPGRLNDPRAPANALRSLRDSVHRKFVDDKASAERSALRILVTDRAAIVAGAQYCWETYKTERKGEKEDTV